MITLDLSSVVVVFSVQDVENNAAVVPITAKWSLYDEDGNVIIDETTITPALEMSVVLDDLPYELSNNHLTLLIDATYASTYGTLRVAKEIDVVVKQRRTDA